nr:MAG TPA: hypothetical protein [Caudoviricetes sp.]
MFLAFACPCGRHKFLLVRKVLVFKVNWRSF